MLAAIGPQMQKFLWWKKYLTALQMIQFVVIFVHSMMLFFDNPCGVPVFFFWVVIVHALMFFVLFKGLFVI
jgi:elongation of very long chain fatty acids protein 7